MKNYLLKAQKRLEGREAVFYKRVRDIYINGRLLFRCSYWI